MRWIGVFIIIFCFVSYSHAQVYVDHTAGGANDGTSWANAYTDLRVAINNTAADQILVAMGTYRPTTTATRNIYFYLRNGVEILGGYPNGGGARDMVANITILSGDIGVVAVSTDNSYHVVYNNGGGVNATAILDGFTIQDAYANGGGAQNDGGGIYFRNCSPTVRNCIIQNNYAADEGGGIYLRDGTPAFNNCTIDNNSANDDAGGVYILNNAPTFSGGAITNNSSVDDYGGVYISNGTASFANVTISSNIAGDEAGGVCVNNGSPVFNTCIVDANSSADDGAGVYIRNTSTPDLTNCTVSNNIITAGNFNGGGFYIIGTSNPTITGCSVTGNTARQYGGGIYIASSNFTNTITGITISNNTVSGGVGYGGGIFLDNSSPDITNNIITNNTATSTTDLNNRGRGGGIYLNGNDVSPLINGNTITGNIASTSGNGTGSGYGGAIYCNQSVPTIDNNTIDNNTATTSGTGANCGRGGGIYLNLSLLNTISNNQITNNNAQQYGGGVYMYRSDPVLTSNTITGNVVTAYMINTGYGGGLCIYDDTGTGTSPTLTSNTISNNQANDGAFATSGYGAGVYIRTGVDPTFITNTISGNTCSQRGGGIYIRDGGTIAIFHRNNINSNTATDGGGIYVQGNIPPEFYNNLIHTNNATNGGGFYFYQTDNGIYLNNTITDNTAINGGGLYCTANADFSFRNNILWNNGAANNIYINDAASDPFFYYNVVEGGTANFQGGGAAGYNAAGNYNPFVNVEIDPQFSDGIYHITLGTSPCIGAGDPATVTGDFPADEDYDSEQRLHGIVDIGAYETNNAPQFVTLPYPPVTNNPGPENVTMSEDEFDALGNPDPFVLNLSAIDLDDENITWSISSPASNGVASVPAPLITGPPWAITKAISYIPNANYNGNDMFVVQVSDGTLTGQITVNVTINSINDAPIFTSTPILTVKATNLYSYNIVCSDVDNLATDLVISSVLALPGWLTLTDNGNGTGLLTGTPGDADVGTPNVTLRVTDNEVTPPDNYTDQVFPTITVTDRITYVDWAGGGDYLTIQEAIDAPVVVNGDKIIVAAGTYNENINFNNKEIEIEGDPANPASVIIDGSGTASVVTFENGEAGITALNGFTIQNGGGTLGLPASFSLFAPSSGMYGGGIFCYQSHPLLKNLIVENNNLAINNNVGGSGAGIYIGRNCNVAIEGPNTIIQNNASSIYRGGGICIDNSTVTIDGLTGTILIDNNSGGNYGGGIAAFLSTITLNNVNIDNNNVDGSNGDGGGLFHLGCGVPTLTNVNFNGNTATVGNNDMN